MKTTSKKNCQKNYEINQWNKMKSVKWSKPKGVFVLDTSSVADDLLVLEHYDAVV